MALDTFLRYFGCLLQVVGLSLAAVGISSLRQRFDSRRPSVLVKVASALERLMVRLRLRRPRERTLVVNSLAIGWGVQAPTLTQDLPPVPDDATNEDRIVALERQVRGLSDRDNAAAKALAKEEVERHREDSAVRSAGNQEVQRVDARIDDLATGGLRLETVGLACLFVGIIMGTIPDGLAWVLRSLGGVLTSWVSQPWLAG